MQGLRDVSDQSWVKPGLEQMTRELFSDNPEMMKEAMDMLGTSRFDGPGMSMAIRDYADEATRRAWQITNEFGSTGIQTLLQLIQGRDRVIGCAAALTFSGAEQLSYSAVQSFQKLKPYFEKQDLRQPVNSILWGVVVTVLARSGHESSEKIVDAICERYHSSRDQVYHRSIERAVLFVGQGVTD